MEQARLVLGGSGFSYQNHEHPETAPILDIIKTAFAQGLRAIDTSPYYEPSERLIGAALADPTITSLYSRADYCLMTKVGRITTDTFNYSPDWISKSVYRSLQRLNTSYLDVVFCHDVEFVTRDEAVCALGVLFEMKEKGLIRHVGISGYPLDVLIEVARRARIKYQKPVDAVQVWAQLNLLNTNLGSKGIKPLRDQGVKQIFSSSPLAVGLLRSGGVPIGAQGDWHPASLALRGAAQGAAIEVALHGDSLAALSLRYALRQAQSLSDDTSTVATIVGVKTLAELEDNLCNARMVLGPGFKGSAVKDELVSSKLEHDDRLTQQVKTVLTPWLDRDLGS